MYNYVLVVYEMRIHAVVMYVYSQKLMYTVFFNTLQSQMRSNAG